MDQLTRYLSRIIPAAGSLSERVTRGVYDESFNGDNTAEDRLSKWIEKAAQGNRDKFDQRLSWWKLDLSAARRILASDPLELNPPPSWAHLVADMLAYLAAVCGTADHLFEEQVLASVPFAHAILPLVAFGMDSLRSRVPSTLLPGRVAECLRVNLLGRIAGVCDLTLGEEFLRYRKAHGSAPEGDETQTELYTAFTSRLALGGFSELFLGYPVLARLVATAIDHWAGDMAAFLLSLQTEGPEIARRFFRAKALAPVSFIHSSLSDPHLDGRTVKIVEFEDGHKIVYKPKNLSIDEAWMGLIAWLGQREEFIDLRCPIAWACGDHGWVEHIESCACDSIQSIRNFYRRAGMLACLLYVVRATDFHYENLIASGDQPVPIDLETLFVPEAKAFPGESEGIRHRFLGTVLQSLLLPNWQLGSDRKTSFDLSGLGSFAHAQEVGAGLTWAFCNTDAMRLTSARGSIEVSQNMPTLPDGTIDPGEFVADIVDGFKETYRALLRNRQSLAGSNGPLEPFRQCSARVVLRATRIYGAMLRRSLSPRLLTNGIDHSLEFEGLSLAHLGAAVPNDGDRIFHAETGALEQLDIPYFDAAIESDEIRGGNGWRAGGFLAEPSFQAVLSRLNSLSETDLEYQVDLIRSSFAARSMTCVSPNQRPQAPTAEPMSPASLVARAETIAAQIADRAIWNGDVADWIGLDFAHETDRFSLRPVGPSLYSGRGGIAVFLAALHLVGGDPEHRRLSLAAARSIWRDWLSPDLDLEAAMTVARSVGIGGASGMAGFAYSLAATGRLLNEPGLFSDALRIARLIDPGAIEADDSYDVIGGAAGAILGLLPLWNETGDASVLDLVKQCAQRLVSTQSKVEGTAGGWITRGERPLTGFSHGAAGIAYALFKAHAATGISEFRQAARRAIRYERSTFVASQNNWPDFQPESTEPFGGSWCRGAPGIGLARLGCLSLDPDEETSREIDTAIQWLSTNPPSYADNLCCGEFGNVELLLMAGARFNRAGLLHHAHARAASALARAGLERDGRRDGFYSVAGPCESVFMPGLFNGLAGIGYQMLRLASPGRVPSVLLWE